MNSDHFHANPRAINRQLKEAASRFGLAASGVSPFGNTAGTQAQLANLQQKFRLQQKAAYGVVG